MSSEKHGAIGKRIARRPQVSPWEPNVYEERDRADEGHGKEVRSLPLIRRPPPYSMKPPACEKVFQRVTQTYDAMLTLKDYNSPAEDTRACVDLIRNTWAGGGMGQEARSITEDYHVQRNELLKAFSQLVARYKSNPPLGWRARHGSKPEAVEHAISVYDAAAKVDKHMTAELMDVSTTPDKVDQWAPL